MFDLIRKIVREAEFRPFTIVMDDGEHITVGNREFIIPVPAFEIIVLQRPEDKAGRALDPGHIKELLRQDRHAA